jgi:HD-like signal output (HDOD) protein
MNNDAGMKDKDKVEGKEPVPQGLPPQGLPPQGLPSQGLPSQGLPSQGLPSALENLSEKDLVALYNIGKIKKLAAGEYLFREGELDNTLFFIQDGSVRVVGTVSGIDTDIARLGKGECIGEIAFTKNTRRTASIIALEPSVFLGLTPRAIDTLKPEIRSTIYRNLNIIAAHRVNELAERGVILENRNKQLVSYIKNSARRISANYGDSEIVQNILNKFPELPTYTTRMMASLVEEKIPANEVVELAKSDPSLVGIVLKTINSPEYKMPGGVADIQHAARILGINQVYQIIIGKGLKSAMPDTEEFRLLYRHSNLISLISYEISVLTKMRQPVLLSTIGLLHDVGKSVLMLLREQYSKSLALLDAMDDTMIGAMLLKKWNLPESIHRSVEYQGYPDFSPPSEVPPECRQIVAILHMAHLCHDYLSIGTHGGPRDDSHDEQHDGRMKNPGGPYCDLYMKSLNIVEKSPVEFIEKRLLPVFCKKLNTFPVSIKQFLEKSGRCAIGPA